MSNIIPFEFEGNPVRVVMIDGEPHWVLLDMCRNLELANPSDVATRLDDDEKKSTPRAILGLAEGAPMVVITEAGLWNLVLRSDKPVAKRVKRWLTHDVIPSIRKTGGYGAPALPKDYPSALRALADTVEQNQRLAAANEQITAQNTHLAKRNEITEPSHAMLHKIKDMPGTVCPTWLAKWMGKKPRKEVFPKIRELGWAYPLEGVWVVAEKQRNRYVVSVRHVTHGGKMVLSLRLTMKGATRLLYEFGLENMADKLQKDFAEAAEKPSGSIEDSGGNRKQL